MHPQQLRALQRLLTPTVILSLGSGGIDIRGLRSRILTAAARFNQPVEPPLPSNLEQRVLTIETFLLAELGNVMTWTRTLTNVRTSDANVVATVLFTSDTGEKITREVPGNDLDADHLVEWCDRFEALLDRRDQAKQSLDALVGQAVPAGKAPSVEDQEKKAFFADLYKLNTLRQSVEKKLTPADDPDLVALEISVKTAFKPEYTADFRWR